jgi:hypothetical protein
MTMVNNIFDGGGTSYATGCWNPSNSRDITFVHNACVNTGTKREGIYRNAGNITNFTVKNNILHGLVWQDGADISHNIYTMLAPAGQKYPVEAGSQFIMFGEPQLFVDHENRDYRLKEGSPAIDAGTDAGIGTDLLGRTRPFGSAPDIGPYEWDGTTGLKTAGPVPVQATPGILVISPNPVTQGNSGRIVFTGPVPGKVRLTDVQGRTITDLHLSYDRSAAIIPSGLTPGHYLIAANARVLGTLTVTE